MRYNKFNGFFMGMGMETKKTTFGDTLKHFIKSVDIVDVNVKNDVIDMIENYLKSALDIQFIVFHTESPVNKNSTGLQTSSWIGTSIPQLSVTIKDEHDKYSTQVAMVFDTKSPAWISGET